MNSTVVIFIACILVYFVNCKKNLIEIVQHNTKPAHLSVLISGQKYDFDKFGVHASDFHADPYDIIDKPKDSNSLEFLEVKIDPSLVHEEMELTWPAAVEQTTAPPSTIKSVDFVIDFVMKVAGVNSFLWPTLLHGIDELRKQYNEAEADRKAGITKPNGQKPLLISGGGCSDQQQATTASFVYMESTRKVTRSHGLLSCL